jgi:hypothetical protein
MNEIKDYKIILSTSYEKVEELAKLALEEEYKLAGGICFAEGRYLQAVYKDHITI